VEALDASQPSPPARSQARAAPGGASVASDRPASSGGALAKGPIGSPGAKAAAGPQSPPTGYPGTSPVRVAGMGSPGKGPKGSPGQLGRYAFNQLSAYKHTSSHCEASTRVCTHSGCVYVEGRSDPECDVCAFMASCFLLLAPRFLPHVSVVLEAARRGSRAAPRGSYTACTWTLEPRRPRVACLSLACPGRACHQRRWAPQRQEGVRGLVQAQQRLWCRHCPLAPGEWVGGGWWSPFCAAPVWSRSRVCCV
jgi:hypothetical protein